MNVDQATAELWARGFDYLESSRVLTMLNNARNEFEDYWPWPWLEQTKTGTAPLAVDRLKIVLYVADTTNQRALWPIDPRDVTADGDSLSQTGTPERWWADGPGPPDDTVTIRPWPVAAVTLEARVTVESPELVAPTDSPLIPARYHPLWIDYAVVAAYKDSDNFSAASQLRADILGRMGAVVERYEVRQRQVSYPLPVYVFSEDD